MKRGLTAVGLMLAVACVSAASAQALNDGYRTRLTSAAFQPPAPIYKGDGNVTARLSGQTLNITGDFRSLNSPATKVRLLSGSAAGVPGGVLVSELKLSASASAGTISGAVRLNPARAAQLRDGALYIQIETQAAPAGALWGWLMPNHPFPGEGVPESSNWYAR